MSQIDLTSPLRADEVMPSRESEAASSALGARRGVRFSARAEGRPAAGASFVKPRHHVVKAPPPNAWSLASTEQQETAVHVVMTILGNRTALQGLRDAVEDMMVEIAD